MNGRSTVKIYTVWLISFFLLMIVIVDFTVRGSPLQNVNTIYEEHKCLDVKTNREMFVGEVFYRRGQCVRVQCLGSLQVWEDRCHVPNLEGNCSEMPQANEFLDYPKCCPQYQCKLFMNDNGRTQETRIHDHYGNRKSTYVTQVFTRRVENGVTMGNVNENPITTQFKL